MEALSRIKTYSYNRFLIDLYFLRNANKNLAKSYPLIEPLKNITPNNSFYEFIAKFFNYKN